MLKRLLVVDDEPDLVNLLKLAFEDEGFSVRTAENGDQALQAVWESPVDCVLLDIMMPGLNGYDVCKRLKTRRETNLIPVIMLTAKNKEEDRIIGLRTGADDYVTKPFDLEEVIQRVNSVMAHNQRLKEAHGVMERVTFHAQSEFKYLEQVNDLISSLFQNTSLNSDEIWELKLALHEVGINAIEHGNKKNSDKVVSISYTLYCDKLEIEIVDEGEGFDIEGVPDPTTDDCIARERGRGIYLVRKLMDQVEYKKPGNTVVLTKFYTAKNP